MYHFISVSVVTSYLWIVYKCFHGNIILMDCASSSFSAGFMGEMSFSMMSLSPVSWSNGVESGLTFPIVLAVVWGNTNPS